MTPIPQEGAAKETEEHRKWREAAERRLYGCTAVELAFRIVDETRDRKIVYIARQLSVVAQQRAIAQHHSRSAEGK